MQSTWARARLATIGAIAAAALLAGALATPAAAGGWATILVDHDTSATTGRPGEPIEVTFTVLQHGVTPIDTEQATVVATEAATGDVARVVAAAAGNGGIYRAELVLPHEGRWRWQVELAGLIAHSQLQDVDVAAGTPAAAAGAASPGIDLLPALAVGIAGALLAAAVLALVARAGRRRAAGAAPTG